MTVVFRILVAAIMAFGAFAAFQAGESPGNYWGAAIVLVAGAAFWFLELTPSRGSSLYAFQYLVLRSLSALIVVALGTTLIWFGISELSSPLEFSRPLSSAVVRLMREVAGSTGLAAALCIAGVAAIVQGLRLLPFRKGKANRA